MIWTSGCSGQHQSRPTLSGQRLPSGTGRGSRAFQSSPRTAPLRTRSTFTNRTMRLLSVSVFTLLLSALEASCAAFSQLCKADQIHDVDICMLFATPQHDPSTYHLVFSGRFPQGRGWAAFGHGSAMDEALMFVFYPNKRENGMSPLHCPLSIL